MKLVVFIVISLMFFLNNPSFSQNHEKIDSLYYILKNQKGNDSIKIDLLNNIGRLYKKNDTDKAIKIAKQAVNLALKIEYKKGASESYRTLGHCFFRKSDFQKALYFYEKTLVIKKGLGDKKGMAISYNNIGLVYQYKQNHEKSIEFLTKSLIIKKELLDLKGIAYSFSNIGLVYYNQGEYIKSLNYHQKALEIMEYLGDKKGISYSLNNLGAVYYDLEDLTKSLEFQQKALNIKENIGANDLASNWNNIGIIHERWGDYNMALECYTKSLQFANNCGNDRSISVALNNIGSIYIKQKRYNKALSYIQKSIRLNRVIGNKKNMCESYLNIGLILFNTNDLTNAFIYINKSLQIALDLGLLNYQKDGYKQFSEMYLYTKEYKKAYEYKTKFMTIKDSIHSLEIIKEIKKNEAKYKLKKTTKEISLLKENLKKTNRINRIKQFVIGLVLFMLIFILLFLVLILKKHKQEKEKSRLLFESDNRYKKLILSLNEGFAINNLEEEFIFANPSAEKIFEVKSGELIGKKLFDFLDENEKEKIKKETEKRKGGYVSKYSLILSLPNNKKKYITANVSPQYNDSSEVDSIMATFVDVTDKVIAEQSLKESEARLKMLINSVPDIICFKDGEGRWLIANDANLKLFNLEGVNYIGKKYSDLASFSPFYHDTFMSCEAADEIAWRSKGISRDIEIIPNASGEDYVFDIIKVPIFNSDNTRNALVVFGRDITNMKKIENENIENAKRLQKAEEVLIKQNENLIEVLNSIEIGAYISTKNYEISFMNREMVNVLGYNAIGEKCHKAIFNHDKPCKGCLFEQIKIMEENINKRVNHINKTYKIKSLLLSNNSKLSLFVDITEITKKNNELLKIKEHAKANSEKLIEAQEKANFGHWEFNAIRNKVTWSNEVYKMYELDNNEFVVSTKEWLKLIHPEDQDAIREMYSGSVKYMASVDIEHRIKLKYNEIKYFHLTCKHIFDENEKLISSKGIILDITKNKKAELSLLKKNKELRVSEERFKKLSNFTFESILIHKNGIIVDINNSFTNLTGYKLEEVINEKLINILIPEKYHKQIKINLKKGKLAPYEIKLIHKNKELIPVEVEVIEIFEEKGIHVAAFRDLRVKKQNEERILDAILNTEEKNKRKFAADIHDGLGPILSTVKLYTQAIKISENPEKIKDAVVRIQDTIDEAIISVQEISNNLSPHILQNFGLPVALKTFCNKIENIKQIKIDYTCNLQERFVDKLEINLYRIVTELINNSLKHSQATVIEIQISYKSNVLDINYKDNGIGFDIQKTINSAHGMGLNNMITRIKSLHGEITFLSEPNEGVTCNMSLNTEPFKLQID